MMEFHRVLGAYVRAFALSCKTIIVIRNAPGRLPSTFN